LGDLVKRLKFIDEMGTNLGLTRLYGRAAPGERVVETTPGHSGCNYSTLAALGWYGVQAPWILAGAVDAAVFENYVEHILAPTLRAGDIVVADNLRAHKGSRVEQIITACGAHLQFLPPYSSDFNPIELCWSKVKTALRAAKARTLEALVAALGIALRTVSHLDVRAWFAHCGYLAL
jgi:transposase